LAIASDSKESIEPMDNQEKVENGELQPGLRPSAAIVGQGEIRESQFFHPNKRERRKLYYAALIKQDANRVRALANAANATKSGQERD